MTYRSIAQRFGDCIVSKDYSSASSLLTADRAVVDVALNGDSFSEAVTLTLAQYGDDVLIRHLEWGRP